MHAIGAVVCSFPRAFAPFGARCGLLSDDLVAQAGANSISFRNIACMTTARRPAGTIRALGIVDRGAIATARSGPHPPVRDAIDVVDS